MSRSANFSRTRGISNGQFKVFICRREWFSVYRVVTGGCAVNQFSLQRTADAPKCNYDGCMEQSQFGGIFQGDLLSCSVPILLSLQNSFLLSLFALVPREYRISDSVRDPLAFSSGISHGSIKVSLVFDIRAFEAAKIIEARAHQILIRNR